VSYVALPKGELWNFDDRKWQVDILDDLHPSIVGRKPTQVGFTTISTCKFLWFLSQYKSRGMMTFPRRDDVTDFVAATLNPIIEGSEYLTTRLGRSDTMRMKRIGESFLHIMEASVTPRMLPVDILVNDEVDLSDPENLKQFVARLDVSQYKYHYRFSTPTVSGYGIDAEYERSDMREWLVTCSKCNYEQFLDWELNVARPDGKDPYYMCSGCHEKLAFDDITNGFWVPTGIESDVHGYQVSHMMMPISRPLELLIRDERTMDRKTFYNLRLGKPWRPIGGSMPATLFMDNSFTENYPMETHRSRGYRYYIGADQGNDVHVVVGRVPDGSDRIEIVYAEHISPQTSGDQFERLAAIIRMFDANFALCDGNPNRATVINMAKEFHGKMGIADIGSYNYPYKWHGFSGSAAYRMNCSRTDMLDGLRDDIGNGRIKIWGQWANRSRVVDQVVKQCGNLKRDTSVQKMRGGGEKVVGVWRSTGADHFAFALSLLRIAALAAPERSGFSFATIDGPAEEEEKKPRKSKVWEDTIYYD